MATLDDTVVEEAQMSFTELAKDYQVLSMTLKDKNVTSINFLHESIEYIAMVDVQSIALYIRDKKTLEPKEPIELSDVLKNGIIAYVSNFNDFCKK